MKENRSKLITEKSDSFKHELMVDKEILVTGATGFVARVLIAKLLQDLPTIGRIHVLIRPKTYRSGKMETANERLKKEVLGSTAFNRLRNILGDKFESLIEEKLSAVAGDISTENLGLSADDIENLQSRVTIIINSAGIVSFDASLKSAFETNTLGPLRLMEFARGCTDALFAHVSTCYVNGTKQGIVYEQPLDPKKDMLENGVSYDVDEESAAISRFIDQVEKSSFDETLTTAFQKIQRKRNSPSNESDDLRREWVDEKFVEEGMKWAKKRGWNDTYTFTKAMGEQMIVRHRENLATLIYRPSIIESALRAPEPGWLDGYRMIDPLIVAYGMGQLPDFPGSPTAVVDMVPVDMVANSLLAAINTTREKNSLEVYQFATSDDNPLTLRSFCDIVRQYFIQKPLRSRSGFTAVPPRIELPSISRFMRRLRYQYLFPLTVLERLLYIFAWTAKGKKVRTSIRGKRTAVQKLIYYASIYSPYSNVLCKYKSDNMRKVLLNMNEREKTIFDFDVKTINWPDYIQNIHIPGIKRFLLGISTEPIEIEKEDLNRRPKRKLTLMSDLPLNEVEKWSNLNLPNRVAQKLLHLLWKFVYRYYLGLKSEGVEMVPTNGPFILVANHTSHLDTGALLVLLSGKTQCLHPVAARDYWFRNKIWSWISRTLINAIPFDRHANFTESLKLATAMLKTNHSLLYFPEGGRSVTGRLQPFKPGLGVLALESGAPIVPVNIAGSYEAMKKGTSLPKRRNIHVKFGGPIYINKYLEAEALASPQDIARSITEDARKAVEKLR